MGDTVRYTLKALECFPWGLRSAARHHVWIVVEVHDNEFFASGVCLQMASRFGVRPIDPSEVEFAPQPSWEIPYLSLFQVLRRERGWLWALRKTGQIWRKRKR